MTEQLIKELQKEDILTIKESVFGALNNATSIISKEEFDKLITTRDLKKILNIIISDLRQNKEEEQ